MSERPLISIIIPAHNCANVLARMMACVLGQTYDNLEVLLVDDGSTDATPALCDELAASDPRVCVFHLPNGGVARARNFALEHMRGKLFAFADADDLMDVRLIERLYVLREAHKTHLSACMALDLPGDEMPDAYTCENPGIDFIVTTRTIDFCKTWSHRVIWGALFDAETLGDLRFDEGFTVSTDTLFVAQYLLKCERMVQTTEKLYCYGIYKKSHSRGGSSTIQRFDDVRVWRRVRDLYRSVPDMGASSSERMYFNKCCDGARKLSDALQKSPEARGQIEPLMEEVFGELKLSAPAFDAGDLKSSLKDALYANVPKLALQLRRIKRACRRFGG